MKKKILYVDMDNVLVDFDSGICRLSEKTVDLYDDRLDDVLGVFSLMDPLQGAIEAFLDLSVRFDTYILSTSPWENPSAWWDKLEWVKNNIGNPSYKRLILSHHKNLNIGDYLIDDRLKNGADRFSGELIRFKSPDFPNWKAVLKYLNGKE